EGLQFHLRQDTPWQLPVPELIQGLERAQARLLDQVLGVRRPPRQATRRPIQVVDIYAHLLLESPNLLAVPSDAHRLPPLTRYRLPTSNTGAGGGTPVHHEGRAGGSRRRYTACLRMNSPMRSIAC